MGVLATCRNCGTQVEVIDSAKPWGCPACGRRSGRPGLVMAGAQLVWIALGLFLVAVVVISVLSSG